MSRYIWIPCLSALALAGCSLAPDYEEPQFDLPSTLGDTEAPGEDGHSAAELDRWWEAFGDVSLNAWVERTLDANTDLEQAAARVRRARAQLGLTSAQLWPSLGGEAQASRTDLPEFEVATDQEDPSNSFAVSGILSYELDLFGRLRNASAAARESLLASAYGYYSLRNMIVADTATTYFSLRAAREQLSFAEDTVSTREEGLRVQQTRYDSGFITQLELQQARAELADAQVQIPLLREQIHRLQTALLILTGAEPEEYWQRETYEVATRPLPEPPALEVDTLPAALLERRPDILAAESELKAAYKEIGVARAQRWPSLSLSGILGSRAAEVDNLFTAPAETWSIAGSLTGPIYDFGRSRNRIRAAEEGRALAYWNYRQVVLEAFGEVSDALAAVEFNQAQVEARASQNYAFSRTLDLARNQYDEGYSDYLELLDAERRAFDSGLALVEARLDQLTAYIDLCKALGGGWNGTLEVTEQPQP